MRTRAAVTAGVAALSILVSAFGHALLAGHPVAGSAVPQLGLLAALCFLLASQRLRPPALVAALALIQVAVHVTLTQTAAVPTEAPTDHEMAGMMDHAGHATASHDALSHAMASHGMGSHDMASMPGTTDAAEGRGLDLAMLGLHLAAMLGTLVLLHGAAVWWERLVVALARVLPGLPRLAPVGFGPPAPAAYAIVATPCPQRWLPATVRRRGPPTS